MKEFLFFLIRCINLIIPKSSKRILFISKPDFSDNTKIFYDYMKVNGDKELIWLCFDSKVAATLNEKFGISTAVIKSFKGIKLYFTSKYIVTSSGSLWQFKAKSQKQFDLWHGIPLKNIICLEEDTPLKKLGNNITMRFATSSLTKTILAAAFQFYPKKICITGQPRTDALFTKGNLEKIIPQYKLFDKVVFYMPTYRKGYKDKNDGREFSSKNIFGFETFDFEKFQKLLAEKNILLLVKLHPYEEKLFIKEFACSSNVSFISHQMLYENGLDVNEILGDIDILMTDYSSVYFDFLLLNKKLIFIPTDIKEYDLKRGFVFENYNDVTPGEKVFTQSELENALMNVEDEYEANRLYLKNMLHRYCDNKSCQRVWEHIKHNIGA